MRSSAVRIAGLRWLRIVAVGALLLAATGFSPRAADAAETDHAGADAEPHAIILMTEYALGPAEITVSPGPVTLRLVNAGIRRHTLSILIDGVEHASPDVRPGDAADWRIALPRAGDYLIWCNEYRHLEKGMGGTVVAVDP